MNAINTISEARNILRESIIELDLYFGHNSTYNELLYDDTYETVADKLQYLYDTLCIQIEELYVDEQETRDFLISIKTKIQRYI